MCRQGCPQRGGSERRLLKFAALGVSWWCNRLGIRHCHCHGSGRCCGAGSIPGLGTLKKKKIFNCGCRSFNETRGDLDAKVKSSQREPAGRSGSGRHQMWLWEVALHSIQFHFFFFSCVQGTWKFQGQGWNLNHSNDQSHSSDNTKSLTR